jgi:hypothetical protein
MVLAPSKRLTAHVAFGDVDSHLFTFTAGYGQSAPLIQQLEGSFAITPLSRAIESF